MADVIDQRSSDGGTDEVLDLIAAVATGDASSQDVVSSLRKRDADTLDVLVALVARAEGRSGKRRAAQRPIDVRRFTTPTPQDIAARIVHREPRVPFTMNETLYDPADVRRFDGQELHFVVSRHGALVAFDDRGVIGRWWELTYVNSLMGALEEYQYGGYQGGGVEPQDGPVIIVTPPPPTQGSSGGALTRDHDAAGTYFYEDTDLNGEELELAPNRGYWDLTAVGRGVFGLGDWNDVISSVDFFHTTVCKLHQHINMGGDSLTLTPGLTRWRTHLEEIGFNDWASSVETW